MHELMFQAVNRCESLKGMSERSVLIPCIYNRYRHLEREREEGYCSCHSLKQSLFPSVGWPLHAVHTHRDSLLHD